MKIQVTENYKIEIGGQPLDFGHKGKLSHVVYLFYLINHKVGLDVRIFQEGGVAQEKFMLLYNHL